MTEKKKRKPSSKPPTEKQKVARARNFDLLQTRGAIAVLSKLSLTYSCMHEGGAHLEEAVRCLKVFEKRQFPKEGD